jgi:aminopeptidase N
VVVETRTEGDVLPRPSGDRYWLLPLGDWYPRPAQSGLEHAAFHFTVDARPPFVPFAPGRVAGREATAERNRVKTELAGPMSHPSVIAGRFQSVTESVEDLNVTVATYFYDKESVARRLALNVLAVEQCLQAWFQTGYPFRDLAIVEINEWGFAQAPAGMMFITQEAFLTAAQIRANSELRTMANLTVGTVDLRMAHEVAHGFFPHVAKLREPEDEWLSESVSDYVSAVCVARTMADEKRGKEQFAQALREWKTYAAKLSGESSVLLANHLAQGQEGDAAQRVWTLYAKGPLVLHALRAELARHAGSEEAGDRLFFGWFQLVVRNSEMKLLSTARALEILDKLTGKSWQPWFEKYVYGTETPRVE